MKKSIWNLIFLLTVLTACSMPGLAPAATATPVPPTPTLEPTITPTLAPIPTQRPEASWTNPIDGAVAAYIPPGEFIMGTKDDPDEPCFYDNAGNCILNRLAVDEQPLFPINVDAFWIYATEVTNTQYNLCIAAGACQPPDEMNTWYTDEAFAQHPVTFVNWFQARDYCHWAGGRLPTEPEWEKAARGGLESKMFPWGDQMPVCDLGAINGANFGDCSEDTLPVGSFSPNGYGLYDVAGNVSEWVSSLWKPYPYRDYFEDDSPLGESVVTRGGHHLSMAEEPGLSVRVSIRGPQGPKGGDNYTGFRCVIPLQP